MWQVGDAAFCKITLYTCFNFSKKARLGRKGQERIPYATDPGRMRLEWREKSDDCISSLI